MQCTVLHLESVDRVPRAAQEFARFSFSGGRPPAVSGPEPILSLSVGSSASPEQGVSSEETRRWGPAPAHPGQRSSPHLGRRGRLGADRQPGRVVAPTQQPRAPTREPRPRSRRAPSWRTVRPACTPASTTRSGRCPCSRPPGCSTSPTSAATRGCPVVGGDFVVATDSDGNVLGTTVAQTRATQLSSVTPTVDRAAARATSARAGPRTPGSRPPAWSSSSVPPRRWPGRPRSTASATAARRG